MNKRQLVQAAAGRCCLTVPQTNQALEAVLETIVETLAAGDGVTLVGFGRFETREYRGRKVQRFGRPGHFEIESRQVPVFRSSPTLRRRLRGEADEE